MMWTAWVKVLGQILLVVGVVVAMGYSRGRERDEFIPPNFAALRLQRRRQRLVWVGVVLALLGLAAQFYGGSGLSIWG